MTRRRALSAWVILIAAIITVDAANDDYWGEVVAGILFLTSWIIMCWNRVPE